MKMRDRAAQELRQSAELKIRCTEVLSVPIETAAQMLIDCFKAGSKVLLCGNGGSASDSQHIAAEFVNRYVAERPALPAIALTTDTSNLTSIGNDRSFDEVFSRQVAALGKKGDVLIGITTSGNSPNVIKAFEMAKKMGVKTICLAGRDGGPAAKMADHSIVVPDKVTSRIQEVHITVGHILCGLVDAELYGTPAKDYGIA
jgi:D-sedoheptulose 7-phosphate isomerase